MSLHLHPSTALGHDPGGKQLLWLFLAFWFSSTEDAAPDITELGVILYNMVNTT